LRQTLLKQQQSRFAASRDSSKASCSAAVSVWHAFCMPWDETCALLNGVKKAMEPN